MNYLPKCHGTLHHYVRPIKWIGVDGKPKEGTFCMHCGTWIDARCTKIGEKGGRVGELLAAQLQPTRYPGKLVIVHHITNYANMVQLEVEIRNPDHSSATFARINL